MIFVVAVVILSCCRYRLMVFWMMLSAKLWHLVDYLSLQSTNFLRENIAITSRLIMYFRNCPASYPVFYSFYMCCTFKMLAQDHTAKLSSNLKALWHAYFHGLLISILKSLSSFYVTYHRTWSSSESHGARWPSHSNLWMKKKKNQ